MSLAERPGRAAVGVRITARVGILGSRLAVALYVDADDEARKVLLPGLSVEVTVDTLGTKEEHEQAVRDSRREKDQRSAAHDAEVRRDRQDHPAGPGQ